MISTDNLNGISRRGIITGYHNRVFQQGVSTGYFNGVFRREVPAGEFTLVEVERYRVGSCRIKKSMASCDIL